MASQSQRRNNNRKDGEMQKKGRRLEVQKSDAKTTSAFGSMNCSAHICKRSFWLKEAHKENDEELK